MRVEFELFLRITQHFILFLMISLDLTQASRKWEVEVQEKRSRHKFKVFQLLLIFASIHHVFFFVSFHRCFTDEYTFITKILISLLSSNE